MKAEHVKYTIEFDVPIKITDAVPNHTAYNYLDKLLLQAVKTQMFYYRKENERPFSARATNIKIEHETSFIDYQI